MLKRIRMAVLFFVVAFGILSTPKTASAQEQSQTYYTYVSQWAIPRAQWADFAKQDEASVAGMKQAVADGLLVDWGIAVTRVHTVDGYTHAEWFTATSRENLLKVLENQWKTATNASYVSATRHADLFLHSITHGGKSVAGGSGYLRVSSYLAKPRAGEALGALMMGTMKGFLDQEVAKGNITLYHIDVEEIHTEVPGAFDLAMLFPDGAAMDRFNADHNALFKSDPNAGIAFGSLTVGEDHRDVLMRVTAYQSK